MPDFNFKEEKISQQGRVLKKKKELGAKMSRHKKSKHVSNLPLTNPAAIFTWYQS
jgi:hypothetical protein